MSEREITPNPGTIQPVGVKDERHTALLEAYKKHATELTAIEDRQNKLVILLLGIFSAAGTLLNKSDMSKMEALYFGVVAVLVVWIGTKSNSELAALRKAVRDLLLRCEIALEYHKQDAFLNGQPLYTPYELGYAERGGWLKRGFYVVWVILVAFIFFLFIQSFRPGLNN